jgi:hypothetical protein
MDFSGMTDAELLSLRTLPPIRIACVSVRGDKTRIGFEAPASVKIRRDDIADAGDGSR